MGPGIDLAVESLFDCPGRGTVVVGTVVAGEVHVGEVLEFRDKVAEVTAIERGRALLPRTIEGDRVGLFLEDGHFEAT